MNETVTITFKDATLGTKTWSNVTEYSNSGGIVRLKGKLSGGTDVKTYEYNSIDCKEIIRQ